jgi:hypothetical protein
VIGQQRVGHGFQLGPIGRHARDHNLAP